MKFSRLAAIRNIDMESLTDSSGDGLDESMKDLKMSKQNDLLLEVAKIEKIPRHVAIIMDGNGRWATKKRLSREDGHTKGIDVADRIIKASYQYGIEFLTIYVFSSDNWLRPSTEVSNIMGIICEYITTRVQELISIGVKITILGNKSALDPRLQQLLRFVESSSAHNKFHLTVALNYGARNEIRNAASEMCKYAVSHKIEPDMISSIPFDKFLDRSVPDPDLLIRTGGEKRVSDFLLWQIAYTELYFTDVLWPDFTEADLIDAIKDFSSRCRRYGKSK